MLFDPDSRDDRLGENATRIRVAGIDDGKVHVEVVDG